MRAHGQNLYFDCAASDLKILLRGIIAGRPKKASGANGASAFQNAAAIVTVGHLVQHPEADWNSFRKSGAAIIHANMADESACRLFPQESGGGLDEFRPACADDRAVAGVGNDPEARVRNGFEQFDGEFEGIERIAVALDDEGAGLDGREKGRREV